ncbi:hypothetical protein OK074_1710 [Actinobacteria bacterium OK074]|nr:hypothetical protein OK074_1710 [Actinobacteria bacterium OK074]
MPDQTAKGEPTPAEHARTILAGATSLTVTTPAHCIELLGLHTADDTGNLVLEDPPGDHLTHELRLTASDGLPAVVELTDIAPVPVRDRVRARLALGGRLTPYGKTGRLVFRTTHAALATAAEGTTHLDGAEFTAALPDPLTACEAELLMLLDATRDQTVASLARLAPPGLPRADDTVHALRLDRYGLVLRLEHTDRTHHDVRLPFPEPARTRQEAVEHVGVLSVRASTRGTRHGGR